LQHNNNKIFINCFLKSVAIGLGRKQQQHGNGTTAAACCFQPGMDYYKFELRSGGTLKPHLAFVQISAPTCVNFKVQIQILPGKKSKILF
jgi:hypothetical protein